jgi:dipeptidyl aminopeptidase/acylaminoacyl peptidase
MTAPWNRAGRIAMLLGALGALGTLAAGTGPVGGAPGPRTPQRLLVLGPLPTTPEAPPSDSPLAPDVRPVPEIPVGLGWPPTAAVPLAAGESASWREAAGPGGLELESGVSWLAARLTLDRFAEVALSVRGAPEAALFVDGAPLEDEALRRSRGTYTVLARVAVGQEAPLAVTLEARAGGRASVTWHLDERVPPVRYERFGALLSTTALAVAPRGELIAREVGVRSPRDGGEERRWMDVIDASGRVVAGHVGGAGASPLAFSPDGSRLALTLPGAENPDLAVWHAASGRIERVAVGEPELSFVRWSPDGTALLVASARGTADLGEDDDATAPSRRVHPRDRVPDYRTGPHLHWIDVQTGARRRLTSPGDFVLDDAVVGPSGRTVLYARTVPREEHPWFETELRRIELMGDTDRRIDTFRAGWEVRPSQLAVSPDGKRLAFVGPPSEVGGGAPAHNVIHTRLYELDLATGERRALPLDPAAAYGYLRAPALGYLPDGSGLITTRLEGSRIQLTRAVRDAGGEWSTMPLAGHAETVERVALSPDGGTAAVIGSSRTRPAELGLVDVRQGGARIVARPNADLASGWLLSDPVPVRAVSPAGPPLDAWYYPPSFGVEPRRVPLAVHVYGGATPTLRQFVPMHQLLAANGYGVLVVNPRGAAGYSLDFADEHAGDWGPAASEDVLAAVDHVLEQRPEINPAAVGVFGGSYGGFVTSFLVSRTDRFGAAVSMYGISDIATYWARGAWGWTYGDMASAGAVPWRDHHLFVDRSPLRAAGRIETPLLLLHGEADVNVPVGESEQLYTALAVQGKPVELVTFPEERHGISGSFDNRIAHRTMILEWFDRHLRDQPRAWHHRWSAGDE